MRAMVAGKRKTLGTFDTEEEAQAFLDAWNEDAASGVIVEPGNLTLKMLGEEFLTKRETHGSKHRDRVASIDSEWSAWRRHVLPSELAEKVVEAIRVADVEDFAIWLRRRKAVSTVRKGRDGTKTRKTDRTISTQTQRHALRIVRQVLDEAVRRELISTNPAKLVVIRAKPADIEEDWLRAEDIDTLLGCKRLPVRDRTAYACALGLSLRLDDIHGIRLEHLYLDAEVPGPHLRVWIAKSEKWHRVPILPWLMPWLRAHVAALPKKAVWLFPTAEGKRYSKSYDFGWAEKVETGRPRKPGALEVAGIKRRVRFHDLRGTCATHLALGTWGRSWSLHEIQRMLAHSDQRVTERYVRRALDMLAAAAAATPSGPSPDRLAAADVAPGCPQKQENVADSIGFEPMTFGSGGRSAPEGSHTLTLRRGQRGGNLVEIARRVVLGLCDGDPTAWELAQQLAEAVLDDEFVRLALEVRANGPHVNRRALELATAIVTADAEGHANVSPHRPTPSRSEAP